MSYDLIEGLLQANSEFKVSNIADSVHIKNGVFWDVTPCGSFLQEPHGVTSQKTPFFIVTAMKTSNLTECTYFHSVILAYKKETL
jgi:hypothetical protein